jgi:hypothetical protein
MGMTDKHFNSFVRLLLEELKNAKAEPERAKFEEKIDKLIDNLQKSLED